GGNPHQGSNFATLEGAPAFLNPSETNSVEIILVDEKGGKIHATIRKQLLYMFQSKIEEGEAYQMS
ncbi:replication factor A protein, partial [Trifolium pratense]